MLFCEGFVRLDDVAGCSGRLLLMSTISMSSTGSLIRLRRSVTFFCRNGDVRLLTTRRSTLYVADDNDKTMYDVGFRALDVSLASPE